MAGPLRFEGGFREARLPTGQAGLPSVEAVALRSLGVSVTLVLPAFSAGWAFGLPVAVVDYRQTPPRSRPVVDPTLLAAAVALAATLVGGILRTRRAARGRGRIARPGT